MELDCDKSIDNQKRTGSSLARLAVRLLIAAIVTPLIFGLSLWGSTATSQTLPSEAFTALDPLLLLYLVPVYVAITVASYVLRSRATFIIASISVAALAPMTRSHVRHTRNWHNHDLAAQDAMFFGFMLATGCCVFVAWINWVKNPNR